ncbi:MAG: CHAT domain-containing protein [Bacteroidales bacterium]|nr:CHAT domain-containing protein [Bacteroidales bacterium]
MNLPHNYRYFLLVLCIFWFLTENLNSQTTADSLGFHYFARAKQLNRAQQYDSAIFCYKKAADWFAKKELKLLNLQSLTEIAYLYSYRNDIDSAENTLATVFNETGELGKDSTIVLIDAYTLKARILCNYSDFEKAVHNMSRVVGLSEHYYGHNHMRTSSAHGNLGIVYSLAGKYDKTIYHCSQASDIIRKIHGDEHPQIASGYNTMGNAYLDLGDVDSAQIMHEKALQIRLKTLGKNHLHTAASYSNLSVVLYQKGDYQKALDYEKMVYGIRKEVYGEKHPLTAQCLNNFGAIYEATGNHSQALTCHQQALAIREASLPANHPDIAMSYMNLANVYRHSNQFDKALSHHNKALEINKAVFGNYSIDVARNIDNIGDIYFRKGDYTKAISKFTEAIRNLNTAMEGKSHPALANYYNNLAEGYLAINKPDPALQCIDSAIQVNTKAMPLTGGQSALLVSDQPAYLGSVYLKARIYTRIYQDNRNDLQSLDLAIKEYKKAVGYMHTLRSGYSGDESKQWLSEESSAILTNAINTLYLKMQIAEDPALTEEFFGLMETGKYGILRESITRKKAMQISGIPDSLIRKERQLAAEIRSCKAEILNLDASVDKLYGAETGRLYKKLIGLEEQYEKMKTVFLNEFPAFEKFAKNVPAVTFSNIRNTLDGKTALISYTIADTMLYIQVFTTEGDHLVHVVIDSSFATSLHNYLASIKTYEFEDFITESNSLYNKLVAPVERVINNKEHLVIVPDKQLLYLPFETLCNNWKPAGNPDFSQAPYLIRKFDIGYHYAVNLLINAINNVPEPSGLSHGFIGFAPVFKTDSTNGFILAQNKVIFDTLTNNGEIMRSVSVNGNTWNELTYSENEIRDIVTLFDNKAIVARGYLHSKASERVFRKEAGQYSFIHIATHGMLNESFPDLSGLVFSPSFPGEDTTTNPPEDDGILFSSELYDLSLNAGLVVLSACETGTGKLVKGEGLMSMTRAFLYAGIPNMVYSLWKVGDISTHKLMVDFYKGILSGLSYSRALQQAKLSLAGDEKYAYPLFWGGITLVARDLNPITAY